MTPLPETLVSPEVVPSMFGAVVRMIGALALLGGAAWVFLRWRGRGPQSRREIRVIDRTALTRGAGLAIVAVADRKLLLSVSADGARLITALDDGPARNFDEYLEESTERTEEAVQ